jgi:branched-chain amino acid transport system substrate-binding protein
MRCASVLACLLLTAGSATACSRPTSGRAPDAIPGVTATQVTVGGLATLSSASGETLPGSDIGARAYFERVDASGGVAGRKIYFLGTRDDGGEPGFDLAAARQLVEGGKVFAVVPALTASMGSAAFLESRRVPTVGYMPDPQACGKAYLFDVTGCSSPPPGDRFYSPAPGLLLAQAAFHGDASRASVAVTVDDDGAGRSSIEACGGPFRSAGFSVVSDGTPVPVGVGADYSGAVSRVMSSEAGHAPTVVWACDNFDTAVGLTAALRAAGYRGLVYSPVTYDPRVPQVPGLRDTLQGTDSYTVIAPPEAATAGLDQVRRDVRAVSPGAQLSLPVLFGYYSAEMFVKILKRTGRDLSAQRFAQVANSGFTFGVQGGLCPVTFPLGHSEGSVGGGLVQLQGAQYQVLASLTCRPMSENVRY